MLKTIITDAIVSPGYEGAPALKFSEKGDAARFRIGKKVYDPKEEDNHRWINLSVKAFGSLCQRLEKMKLKEGSFVNLSGRLDEDTWEDKRTGEKHSAMVIVLDEIEYSGGSRKKEPEAAPGRTGGRTAPTQGVQFYGLPGIWRRQQLFRRRGLTNESQARSAHRRKTVSPVRFFLPQGGTAMTKKDWQRHMAYEALVILGVLALLLFVCRLWPILFLAMLGIIAATLRLLFLSSPRVRPLEPMPPGAHKHPARTSKEAQASQVLEICKSKLPGRCGRSIPTPGGCGKHLRLERDSDRGKRPPSCSTGRGAIGKRQSAL